MNSTLSSKLQCAIAEFLEQRLGLQFQDGRLHELERGLQSAAQARGFTSVEQFVEHLLTTNLSESDLADIAQFLTIGETYFFRDKALFKALEFTVLPELIEKRRSQKRLRIWSAGCCTGEEPYSIAILLERLLPDISDWHVTILASDINPAFLSKATAGVYGEWSFRDNPAELKTRYFTLVGKQQYSLLPRIRELVTFRNINLRSDTFPSLNNNTFAIDLILCRNVLMYFSTAAMCRAIAQFELSLVKDGWLILSPSEASHKLSETLMLRHIDGALLFQKSVPPVNNSEELSGAEQALYDKRLPKKRALVRAARPLPEADLALASSRTPRRRSDEVSPATTTQVSDAISLRRAAEAAANAGNLDEAIDLCRRAIKADSTDYLAYFLLAITLQENDELEESLTSLKHVVYLEPQFVQAYVRIAELQNSLSRPRDAQRNWRNALDLLEASDPDSPVPESGGMTAFRLREHVRAAMTQGARA